MGSAIASLVFWLGFSWRGPSWAKTSVKALPVGLLLLGALVAGQGQAYPLILGVLAAGLVGDAFLSRPSTGGFLTGMAGFAVLHILLVAQFLAWGIDVHELLSLYALILLVLACGLATLIFPRAGALRWPVMGYIAIIAAMALAAIGLDAPNLPREDVITLQVGVALFVLSDALIGLEMFVLSRSSRWRLPAQLTIWPTYSVAMALFTLVALG
ncbi:MAG: lysoplasmalogenase [Rhodobacteraceae bacterium]|nr:lysoplasmalogenase [Paracoccaceae bacterium]